MKYIEQLNPVEIAQDDKVQKSFIEMYNNIHGEKMGASIYHKECFNFTKLLQENTSLQDCSKLSLYGCFLDIAVNGLSLESSRPLCYIIPRSVKTGQKNEKGKDIYEKRATVSITAYGELVMRKRAGQINYADNPVIVYDGDIFEPELNSQGQKTIRYKAASPRKSTKIVGAFIRIVRNDGSIDYQWLMEGDIDRLKGYSKRANSYWNNQGQFVEGSPNKLYESNNGQIDPGFLENKMIKHAFDAYPKVRTGYFTNLETNEEPEINYGFENIVETDSKDITDKAAFGEQDKPQTGITYDESTDSF